MLVLIYKEVWSSDDANGQACFIQFTAEWVDWGTVAHIWGVPHPWVCPLPPPAHSYWATSFGTLILSQHSLLPLLHPVWNKREPPNVPLILLTSNRKEVAPEWMVREGGSCVAPPLPPLLAHSCCLKGKEEAAVEVGYLHKHACEFWEAEELASGAALAEIRPANESHQSQMNLGVLTFFRTQSIVFASLPTHTNTQNQINLTKETKAKKYKQKPLEYL